MENLEKKLLNEINDFVESAVLTTKLFQEQYSINTAPIKTLKRADTSQGVIPMSGVLHHDDKQISYKFHGNGCRFVFPKERIIDINYQLPEGDYDGRFSFYRIWEFVKSAIPIFKDKDLFETYLSRLEKGGLIMALPFPSDFKEKITLGSEKSVELLEEEGFFKDYDRPIYKSYRLKANC